MEETEKQEISEIKVEEIKKIIEVAEPFTEDELSIIHGACGSVSTTLNNPVCLKLQNIRRKAHLMAQELGKNK